MGVAWRPAGGEHLLNTRSSTAKSRKSEKKLKFFVFPYLLSLIEDINGEVGGWMVSDLVSKCSAVMAPTCYSMKNLHYRTQSLPESVHQYNHLLNAHLGASGHHPDYGLQLHPGKLHSTSAIKKRAALRRSQTSVADLLPHGVNHHRAPLAQGVYEAFLPPPNFNSIGLPTGAQLGGCGMTRARSRTQSFYVPSHYMAPSSTQHQLLPSSPYPSLHHSQANMLGMDQCSSSLGPQWYHRSVPNLHPRSLPYLPQTPIQPTPQAKSVTTPLFVDCSVEYDLGEQPVIPADSEPLLSIHPEYVARSLSSSPYSMFQPSVASSSRPSVNTESASKSMPDMALRVHRRSHPRPSPHRTTRPSPRARASLAAKLEATRKLSVESRDSGIGLMNSAGTISYSQAYPSSSPAEAQTYLPHLQTQFTGKVLPTSSNKRFGISDLVTGLLCCSAPHQAASSHLSSQNVMNDTQTESCKVQQTVNTNTWTQQQQTQSQALQPQAQPHPQAQPQPQPNTQFQSQSQPQSHSQAFPTTTSTPPDARTVEWVVASQRAMACQSTCQSRDCNEGFCYNVWNNMVHV